MAPIKTAICAGLVAAVVTSGWRYHDSLIRSQEAAQLRSANEQLRLQAGQRHEARSKQALISKVASNESGLSSPEDSHSPAGKSTSFSAKKPPTTSVTNYRNEGQSTPLNSLQTFAWACDQGDTALMEKLIVFDGTAREKAVKYFASLPTGMPPQFPSLDAMAAALYISDGIKHPYPVADILQAASFEPINPTRMVLHLPDANGDGYEFQSTSDGWKVVITDAVVDDYIKESSSQPPQP